MEPISPECTMPIRPSDISHRVDLCTILSPTKLKTSISNFSFGCIIKDPFVFSSVLSVSDGKEYTLWPRKRAREKKESWNNLPQFIYRSLAYACGLYLYVPWCF
jgi:hypothetical protein